ncbi:MAG: hypothetical protein HYZ17_02365 [Betaproteobacteria bacterium]|nr:hypothetical protein [Betaproteobacteria bacterium]
MRQLLDNASLPQMPCRFFWFETVGGESVIVNLSDVQAVRYLWDPAEAPSDLKRSESAIQIQLRGRATVLEESAEDSEELYGFFSDLEQGAEGVAFPSFTDIDGEPLQLNAREVVWVIAPAHLLDEGARRIGQQADLDGAHLALPKGTKDQTKSDERDSF